MSDFMLPSILSYLYYIHIYMYSIWSHERRKQSYCMRPIIVSQVVVSFTIFMLPFIVWYLSYNDGVTIYNW